MLWHIFKNGWEDKQFIEQRVYGMDDIRKEVEKWTAGGSRAHQRRAGRAAQARRREIAKKAVYLIWAMGQTQHTVGTANVRASCILLLATGNVGGSGSGANIFRGHDQRAGRYRPRPRYRDLPLYYGLAEGAWRHWSRVWEVDFEWMKGRFDTTALMNTPGIP